MGHKSKKTTNRKRVKKKKNKRFYVQTENREKTTQQT